MSKVPIIPEAYKEHPNLSNDEEKNERILRELDNENREFYELNAEMARRITDIQTGINERAIHELTRNSPAPALPENAAAERVREERVQAELYRAVASNETYETELGEDPKNYLGSENVEHLSRNWPRRLGRNLRRVSRGAAAMVGFNNTIERRINQRFGADKNVNVRRDFVAQRLMPELVGLTGAQIDAIGRFLYPAAPVGFPFNALWITARLAVSNLSTLRNLRDFCEEPPAALGVPPMPFVGSNEYVDLMMLVDADQRIGSKIGLAEVYKEEPLRRFWNDVEYGPSSDGNTQAMKTRVMASLVENSLYPLDNNPDSIALLAELRGRIVANMRRAVPPQTFSLASLELDNEIQDIVNNEIPSIPRTKEEKEAIATMQKEISRLIKDIQKNLAELSQRAARDAAITARLAIIGPGAPSKEEARQLTTEQGTINQRIIDCTAAVKSNAQEIEEIMNTNHALAPLAWVPPNIAISTALTTPSFLVPAGTIANLSKDFASMSDLVTTSVDKLIPSEKAKLTPFQLLQRLMRRDYMREKQLNAREFNEEANQYATIKAALRVEDVKSIDRMRSANARAAEYMNRGLAKRGWDRFKKHLSGAQDTVGLEFIDFENMTADRLLEQIINSNPDFQVFKGVNKFTTIRDLRYIINKKGKKVPREVVERFAAVLQEAIDRYRVVAPELEKGLITEDWDLEVLIDPLKKLRMELWTEELLVEVNKSPESSREQAMVQMLHASREKEAQIAEEIVKEVEHPDAPWRVQLAKKELKIVLDKEALDGMHAIKQAGIEEKKQRIKRLETRLGTLAEGSPQRDAVQKDIDNLKNEIVLVEQQMANAVDLHERVKNAREYLKTHKLSRKQKKEYLKTLGLTQVWDKMSQNFRAEDTWAATKRGAKAFWEANKKAWKWSRKKFLNAETAKSVGSKTFSILRYAASPITYLPDKGWKAVSAAFNMTDRAFSQSLDAPWWLMGMVSKGPLRRFYRLRMMDEKERLDTLVKKHNNLKQSMNKGPYAHDKKRVANDINNLEEKVYKQNARVNAVVAAATKNGIAMGELAVYSEVQNDGGEIVIINTPAADNVEAAKPKAS